MNQPDDALDLPQGARGLRAGEFVVSFGENVVVFTAAHSPWHVTIARRKSGDLDVHATYRNNQEEKRVPLLLIPQATLKPLTLEFGRIALPELPRQIRPLALGWMARQRIEPVLGVMPDIGELGELGVMRRRKLELLPELISARARQPVSLLELYDLPAGAAFPLFAYRRRGRWRRLGTGYRATAGAGFGPLVWTRDREILRMGRRLELTFRELAAKHGVSLSSEMER